MWFKEPTYKWMWRFHPLFSALIWWKLTLVKLLIKILSSKQYFPQVIRENLKNLIHVFIFYNTLICVIIFKCACSFKIAKVSKHVILKCEIVQHSQGESSSDKMRIHLPENDEGHCFGNTQTHQNNCFCFSGFYFEIVEYWEDGSYTFSDRKQKRKRLKNLSGSIILFSNAAS